MAQTAAQRAVDVFVSAVTARGGKADVTTKGNTTFITVTASGRTETLRVKATTGDTWQARRSEAVAKAPVTAWALVDLSDGAPIALVSAPEYAAHVAKLVSGWETKNPGKTLTANTTLAVTADAVADWEDDWALLGLDAAVGTAPKATPATAGKSTATAKPTKAAAKKPTTATKVAGPANRATPQRKNAPTSPAKAANAEATPTKATKAAPAKTAGTKAAATKATAAPTKSAGAKTVAAKATTSAVKPAAGAAKGTEKKAPVKASEAKITPIDAQKDAAAQAKAPASIDVKPATTPKSPAAQSGTKAHAEPSKQIATVTETKPSRGPRLPLGIGLLLKRLPVVGRLL